MPFKGTVMNPVEGRDPFRFGEIPEYPVGYRWADRRQLCDAGVHAHLSGGIHGRGGSGAFSVVLSGGYVDDVDLGEEFTYTGQGGQAHREPGTKWSNVQVRDQEWKLGNLALKTSFLLKRKVRVIRGSRLNSPYAPSEGYRYDGLYTVEEASRKSGIDGLKVCLFRFVRCPDQEPLPGPTATLPMKPERPHTMASLTQSKRSVSSSSGGDTLTDEGKDRKPHPYRQRSLDSNAVASSSRNELSKPRSRHQPIVAAYKCPTSHGSYLNQPSACKAEETSTTHPAHWDSNPKYDLSSTKGKEKARDAPTSPSSTAVNEPTAVNRESKFDDVSEKSSPDCQNFTDVDNDPTWDSWDEYLAHVRRKKEEAKLLAQFKLMNEIPISRTPHVSTRPVTHNNLRTITPLPLSRSPNASDSDDVTSREMAVSRDIHMAEPRKTTRDEGLSEDDEMLRFLSMD